MTNPTILIRTLVTYGVVLPLAIILGYLLSTPLDTSSFWAVGLVLSILVLPLLLRWHHPMLFLSWNMLFMVFFLPGKVDLWLLMAFASFGIVIVQRTINTRIQLNPAPSVLSPLLFLALVVYVTAYFSGGIQLGAMGGQMQGGKRYLTIFAAILGYIAMSSHVIPPQKAGLYVGLFFLGSLTYLITNLVPFVSPSFYIIFSFFPPQGNTLAAVLGESDLGNVYISRNFGLSVAFIGPAFYMLARYGIKQQLEPGNIWKLFLSLTFFACCLVGGFRSMLLLVGMTAFLVFLFEKLYRTKLMFVIGMTGFLAYVLLIPLAIYLPLPIQRATSVLPLVKVDPVVEMAAQSTSEWRLQMWKDLLPEVPEYFWLGKGLGIKVTEYDMTGAVSDRLGGGTETFKMAGDYHSGPLSVMIPFGIWGAIGLIWFWWAAIRVLNANYRYGEPHLKTINALLLAVFLTRIVVFLFVFGSLYSDLAQFAGLVGLSVSLNGGVCKPPAAPVPTPNPAQQKLPHPGRRFAPRMTA